MWKKQKRWPKSRFTIKQQLKKAGIKPWEQFTEKEQLEILYKIVEFFQDQSLQTWIRMIDNGQYKTPECDQAWHETNHFSDLLHVIKEELNKKG